jgi:hypothetical protein
MLTKNSPLHIPGDPILPQLGMASVELHSPLSKPRLGEFLRPGKEEGEQDIDYDFPGSTLPQETRVPPGFNSKVKMRGPVAVNPNYKTSL